MLTARREMRRRIECLRQIPWLAGCSFDELARVDRLGALVELSPGRTLTREGTVGRECFVVLDGTAIAERAGQPVGVIDAGSIAGELALLDHAPRNATVVARTPMRVIVFTEREFEDLVGAAPSVEAAVGRIAAARRSPSAASL